MAGKLIPDSVTLSGEVKFFTKDNPTGATDGSFISTSFKVPAELAQDPIEYQKQCWAEKEKLDLFALNAEYMKGSCPDTLYKARKERIKKMYDKLLGRNTAEANAPDAG